MERLTYDFAIGETHCWEVHGADNLVCADVCKNQSDKGCEDCPIRKAIDRLAAYEDTGLMPEEIHKLISVDRWNDAVEKEWLKHLQMEKEGRSVILPCKVGETVWITASYMTKHDPPIAGKVIKFEIIYDGIMSVQALIWADLGEGKKEYGFSQESFGKIIFLSKREAEAALREQEE